MTPRPPRFPLLRRLGKLVLVSFGVIVIVLALALGLFRLLVGQIPEYQDELKAWVARELGVVVDFDSLDARLGFAGPELSLRGTQIGEVGGDGFLQAEQAAITLDPVALVLGRRIGISRLTLAGVHLTVERDPAGTFRLGEYAVDPGGGGLAGYIPQSVEVVIRDSVLRYVDADRGRSWEFDDLELAVESTDGQLTARASLRPPDDLGGPVELGVTAELPDGTTAGVWRVDAAAESLGLAALSQLLPVDFDWPVAGDGDVSARAEWRGGTLEHVAFDVDLGGVRLGPTAGDSPSYDSIALSGEWQRGAAADWELALDRIDISRAGRSWEPAATVRFALDRDAEGVRALDLAADYIRLDDLRPVVRAFPDTQLAEQWALFEPVGEVRDLEFSLERRDQTLVYALDAAFAGLAVNRVGEMPGIVGVAGRVQASEDSGTIEFASDEIRVDWPRLFPQTVVADSLTGAVVWRQGRDAVQILSVDLGVGVAGREAHASFDFSLPRDDSPPTLDLEAELEAVDLVTAKRYLPTPIMPAAVVDWLDQAVVGGRGRDIELSFFGPLNAFPFDDGGGQFRVAAVIEDATLDYLTDWPQAEDLDGRIEFANAGFSASGTGSALGNRAEALSIRIPDLREPLMNLAVETVGPLTGVVEYLRTAPLIAAHLGADFDRIEVLGGSGAVSTSLELPLRALDAYTLDAALEIRAGEVAVAGLAPEISEIEGVIRADETGVVAEAVDAVFLGGPVSVALAPSDRPGYRAELAVEGETAAEAIAGSFALPHGELLAGQTRWRGRLLLPALDPLATTPARITIESNLNGVALRFPEPLAKPPGAPSNLRLDLEFAAGSRLEMSGNLGATRRFVLSFGTGPAGLEFQRGAVRFGGGEPTLPIQAGILINGRLESFALDRWLELAGDPRLGRAGSRFLGADVELADFHVFGQQLGATSLRVHRGESQWEISVDSEPIAGEILVPRGAGSRRSIVADMQRVYLAVDEGGDLAGIDPRELPGLRLTADELGIGPRRFGRVSANVDADRRGLVLSAFSSETANYRAELEGHWFQGADGTQTAIEATLDSSDVEAALTELGIDPAISGESAELTASVHWNAAPGTGWLDHLDGEVSLVVETGTLREIDPGAGRMLGLMSIAALPRRLTLDFRDVFEDGFAFDEITGSFTIIDGNAYTNGLKFTGPAAEIGVVGRTGLRDRDYRQQVVVSPEPGNMLPTVAGLLGGPGAGAALFVFTRLFKEPLKGIGQVSYCLEGSWEEPVIQPIDKDESELARRCAELPDTMREPIVDE